MSILGIEQITYGVDDLATCRRFFADWGMKEVAHDDTRARFETLNGCTVLAVKADDPALPPALHAARAVCERVAQHAFTSVGMNLYRDGNDSVAPHNDRLDDLIEGAPIALLSLGATRRLVLTTKTAPKRRLALDLEPGSVLVMSYATQLHLDHGVPKTRETVGPRISLAFRARPPKDERRGVHRPRYVPVAG